MNGICSKRIEEIMCFAIAAGDIGSTVVVASATCNGSANDSVSAYFAEAHPLIIGSTGQRSFATDSRGAIYFNTPGVTRTPGMAGAAALQ